MNACWKFTVFHHFQDSKIVIPEKSPTLHAAFNRCQCLSALIKNPSVIAFKFKVPAIRQVGHQKHLS
jgi:hypothetical protein